MAYADGVADEARARAVEEAVAEDPKLAERLAALQRVNGLAREALGPLLREPVPDALEAHVRAFAARHPAKAAPDKVVAFAPRRPRAQFGGWAMALAASVCLSVGVGAGYLVGVGLPVGEGSTIRTASLDHEGLGRAMVNVASGDEVTLAEGARFRAIATFRSDAGAVCREFELDEVTGETLVAVACHDDGTWATTFTVASAGTGAGYAPASSLETLNAYLESIGASAPMELDEEASALAATRAGGT